MDSQTRRMYLARVRDFVDGLAFPATRAQVVAQAERKNTPSDIMHDLNRLKSDHFASLEAVIEAVDAQRYGPRVTSNE